MTEANRRTIQRDWLSKTLAGVLLGLCFAFVCSAIFAHIASGLAPSIRAQLAMWMVIPVWLCVLSGSYLFASGKSAWLWLGLANVVVVSVLASAKMLL